MSFISATSAASRRKHVVVYAFQFRGGIEKQGIESVMNCEACMRCEICGIELEAPKRSRRQRRRQHSVAAVAKVSGVSPVIETEDVSRTADAPKRGNNMLTQSDLLSQDADDVSRTADAPKRSNNMLTHSDLLNEYIEGVHYVERLLCEFFVESTLNGGKDLGIETKYTHKWEDLPEAEHDLAFRKAPEGLRQV